MRKFLICFSVLIAISACSGKSDKLLPTSPSGEKAGEVADIDDPKIDILFVVDDSGSMDEHQRNLSANINMFVDEIKNLNFIDYHIGVTTSSVDTTFGSVAPRGQLYGNPAFVDRNTPNGDYLLKQNLIVGINGSGSEQLLNPVYMALTPPMSNGPNVGFYRPDAYLAVIFITDTEDGSARTSPSMNPTSLYNFLLGLKLNDPTKILGYGAIVPVNGAGNCSRDSEGPPYLIEQFLRMVKGQFFSLCDPRFGLQLAAVAKNLVKNVTRVIHLRRWPVVSTIKVSYGRQIIANDYKTGWVYEPSSNSILFGENFVLSNNEPPGTKLEISFVTARGE